MMENAVAILEDTLKGWRSGSSRKYLRSKCEALSSNPSAARKEGREEGRSEGRD
jgi:hypothetical protein